MILILLDAPKCSGPLWSEREGQAWKRTSLRFRCFLFLELYFINGQLESQKLAFYFLFLYLCEKGESTHVSLPKLLCLYKSSLCRARKTERERSCSKNCMQMNYVESKPMRPTRGEMEAMWFLIKLLVFYISQSNKSVLRSP